MVHICERCGTPNKDDSQFCLYCGAPLPPKVVGPTAPDMPSPAPSPPAPKPAPAVRPASPDFVGLFGVAFFFLVLAAVFYLNSNLLTELRVWFEHIFAGRIAFRPPEGVIMSGAWFWGLLGVANFAIAFLRWEFTRSRIGTLGAFLGGVGMITFAYFLYRYSLREMSGSLVVALEAFVVAALLFVFIGLGLYWTTLRRRPAVATSYRALRR